MFYRCSSLKELKFNNFNVDKENGDMFFYMFSGCPNELILKIKTQYKNLNEKAFQNN